MLYWPKEHFIVLDRNYMPVNFNPYEWKSGKPMPDTPGDEGGPFGEGNHCKATHTFWAGAWTCQVLAKR